MLKLYSGLLYAVLYFLSIYSRYFLFYSDPCSLGTLLDRALIVLRAASPAFWDNKAATAFKIVQIPVRTVTTMENITSKSVMLDETIYWNANVKGQIWYDIALAPFDIVRRVSNILFYSDSTNWLLFRGSENTLNELKIWAKASRHCYRYSPGRNSCAIKCADITGKWNKWEDVPWIAIILKKAYDDGDKGISIKYTDDKMVKNKLCNLNFI